MSWDTLTVVAAEAPLGKTGAAIGQPIVRDTQGRIFVVRDVLNEDPYPNMLIDEQELRSGKVGSFVIVPECQATLCFLTVVLSAEFHQVLKQTGPHEDLAWEQLDTPELRFAYIEMDRLTVWRDNWAKSLRGANNPYRPY